MTPPKIRESLLVVAALAAVAATVALLRLVPGVNPTTAGFALLMLVLLSATIGPLWIAITVAVASTLSFNYFFFPPVGTFTIADAHNWVALFAFLLTAVIGSNLSAAAQERARMAVERAHLVEAREAAELQRQRGELASTLLASLSHDLKTPLTVIQTAIDNLCDQLPDDAARTQAAAAKSEVRRLTRLFEDILDMARIDAAAITVTREWVTPADVVDAALAHVRHATYGRSFRVNADGERAVHIDARLASIALSHLIENAARYSPPNRDIIVNAWAAADGCHITVTDNGSGIDPDDLERLFERFYRGQRAQQTTIGSGMGLAISRGLVTAIGGRVWAENVPGAGARFSIEIPAPIRLVNLDA